jgi:hypothetical protein
MRNSVSKGTLAAAALFVALSVGRGGSALAHHSFSMFDMKATKTITGTVKQFEWTNPHTWLWIMVPNDKGDLEQWGIEGMSPNFLGRRGWSKNTLKPGDKISVDIHPLRNGEKGGTFLNVTLPDGKQLKMFGAQIPGEASAEGGKPGDASKAEPNKY